MVDLAVKRCPICDELKPVTDFNRNAAMPDGFQMTCRDCHKVQREKWSQKYMNPEARYKALSKMLMLMEVQDLIEEVIQTYNLNRSRDER